MTIADVRCVVLCLTSDISDVMKNTIPTIEELKHMKPVYPFTEQFIQAFLDEGVRLGIIGYVMKKGEKAYYRKRWPTEAECEQITAFEDDWHQKRGIPKSSTRNN